MDLISQINFKPKLRIIARLIRNIIHDGYTPNCAIFLIKQYLEPWKIKISDGEWLPHRRNLKKTKWQIKVTKEKIILSKYYINLKIKYEITLKKGGKP